MRDYLYLWHEPEHQFLVASGLEFKDFMPSFATKGGAVLIEHQSDTAIYDSESGFGFTPSKDISQLNSENIYSWGTFVWADYATQEFPKIPDQEISELLFFAHKAKPLHRIPLPSLQNDYLAYAHDDGWYLQIFYSKWSRIIDLVSAIVPSTVGEINTPELKLGVDGFWLQGGNCQTELKTHDVDSVLNRRL